MLRTSKFFLIITLLSLIFTACSGKDSNLEQDIAMGVAATLTKQAYGDEIEAIRQTAESATSTPEPIVHVDFPDFSPGSNTFVTDFSSLGYAPEKSTVGDYFQMNRMERPFSAGEMDYFGDLDIIWVDLKYDLPWFYATIIFTEDLRDEGIVHYGLELDLDADGRGDYLIWALLPPGTDWTTDGVQVLEDKDNDIGGEIPLKMEVPNPELNGYETELFNAGAGDDPDLAWVRRDPEDTKQLQVAFKDSFTSDDGFLWSAWVDNGLMDPAQFDYNDQYTLVDAGSPNSETAEYPLDEVALVDSTCRSWYGMTPIGTEPGLCAGEQTKKPGGGNGNGNGNGDKEKQGYCVVVGALLRYCPKTAPCLPTCPPRQTCKSCTLP